MARPGTKKDGTRSLSQRANNHSTPTPVGTARAGAQTSGQVLVIYDLLGLNNDFKPRFVKHYASLEDVVVDALSSYRDEVESRAFPADEHTFQDRKKGA